MISHNDAKCCLDELKKLSESNTITGKYIQSLMTTLQYKDD